MATARIRIEFNVDSNQPLSFERDIELAELREDGGREFVAESLFSQLAKDARYVAYRLALPNVEHFLRPVKQTFRLEETGTDTYQNRVNTREMWWEIGNTFLRVEHQLATARAYHDEELTHASSQNSEAQNLAAWFHTEKMDSFDLGAVLLNKTRDLAARLVFERLGESLIPKLDKSDPEWERVITPKSVRKGLSDRTGNPHVAALQDDEYTLLLEILDDLRKTDAGTKLESYRNKLAHRITPSVDRTEFYSYLQTREWTENKDESGKIISWSKGIGERPTISQYSFPVLYENAVQTLQHHIDTLKRLDAMPRFGPEAHCSATAAA